MHEHQDMEYKYPNIFVPTIIKRRYKIVGKVRKFVEHYILFYQIFNFVPLTSTAQYRKMHRS